MDECGEKFEPRPHLAKHKRLPKCYKEVEKILKDVKACKGNVKTLLSNSRLRGMVFKKVYAITINVLRNRPILDKIIEETELLKKEPFLREELAGILVYELVFGKGLLGDSNPITVVMKYKDAIDEAYQNAMKDESLTLKGLPSLPRYARINTLLTTVPDVVKNLRRNGFYHVYYGEEISEFEYLDLVQNLGEGKFMIDYHFKDLLVFAGGENLTTWSLYQKNYVYIQDKSSYIPVIALDPKPGSIVIDACAAPGMKTIHIAASMENKGKIYAYEKDNSRFEILKDMLQSSAIEICEADCEDFYLVNTNDPKFRDLEYILVDPSCSGSGMVSRMDAVTDTKDSKNAMRLQKLAGFQILLLKHALSFPSVKRVVYSTCSITEEENEYVVHEVLAHFEFNFKLVSVLPDWPVRGSDNYKYGNLCLRAYPERNLTNGFFVAMFERMNYDEQLEFRSLASKESFSNQDKFSKKRKGKSKVKQDNCKTESSFNCNGNGTKVHETSEIKFKNKSHKQRHPDSIIETFPPDYDPTTETQGNFDQNKLLDVKTKKKKHKRKQCEETSDNFEPMTEACPPDYEAAIESQINIAQEESTNIKTRKKKHHRKHCKETKESSDNLECVVEAYPGSELTTESQDSSSQKKKIHNTKACDASDPDVEMVKNTETSHKNAKSSSYFSDEEVPNAKYIEKQSIAKAKVKKRHACLENDEHIEYCCEDVDDTTLDTAETYSKKRHKKKCKNKRTKEE